MAMQILVRNRIKSNPENKFEQTSNLCRNFLTNLSVGQEIIEREDSHIGLR